MPQFEFKGLHPPALIEAYFSPAGTTLIIRFDSQPVDRSGMNGLFKCSTILDDATSAQLQGSAAADGPDGGDEAPPPLCFWADDTTLVTQLTMHTLASRGMRVGIRAGSVWPKGWAHPGSCSLPNSKCNAAASLTLDADFPCDRHDTPFEVESIRVRASITRGLLCVMCCCDQFVDTKSAPATRTTTRRQQILRCLGLKCQGCK